ncbi:MAG: DNA repair protein RecN [Propionibacteriaceae bacterium]|nr:DNA repair protein RecN [Propionibacteriaceae bacterium]
MLSALRIVDLGVIGEAEIEPSAGFTAVTGETGAGKTMVVTGLSLLTGAKADASLIRSGAQRALVEGRVSVPDGDLATVVDLGAVVEDGEVLLSRQLTPGRSRELIGGAQIPAATAAKLTSEWITIHGQMEQVRLGSEARQREILDTFAGAPVLDVLKRYKEAYAERRSVAAELSELEAQAKERARELDTLTFSLEEIEAVDPQPGEDVALAAQAQRLQAVDDLRLAATEALTALAGTDYAEDPDALSLVAAAKKALESAADTDPLLKPAFEQIIAASISLSDAASELSGYLGSLEADPIRLEHISARLSDLQGLTRKYGDNVDAVLEWSGQAALRAAELSGTDEKIGKLRTALEELDGRLAGLAAELSEGRKTAAAELEKRAAKELAPLALPDARLSFSISGTELGPNGGDRISLQFSANPGSAPGPLAKVASGGELSRVRLALEVVLAEPGQTFVFDEVDAGIGGQVALEVGRRLKRLAEHSQVIVVTHLAQVAAFADKHYVVSKSNDGQVTSSSIHEVGEDRAEVLATMMSGLNDAAAVEHARALLAEAGNS